MQYGLSTEITCDECHSTARLSDRFCHHCGRALSWSSVGAPSKRTDRNHQDGISATNANNHLAVAPATSATAMIVSTPRQLAHRPVRTPVQGELIVNPDPMTISQAPAPIALLNHRSIVLGLLLFVGPAALPALWFSPTFSMRSKVITSVLYLGLTILVPLAVMFYWLQIAVQPLLDVLPTKSY